MIIGSCEYATLSLLYVFIWLQYLYGFGIIVQLSVHYYNASIIILVYMASVLFNKNLVQFLNIIKLC